MKYIILIALVWVTIPALAQSSRGDLLYQQAQSILDKGDVAKAAKAFLSARDAYWKENNAERYFVATQAASIIYQDTGEGVSAEKILEEALQKIPPNSVAHYHIRARIFDNLGYTYLYTLNDAAKALDAYTQSINAYANAAMSDTDKEAFERVNRAIVYETLGDYENAIADWNKAIGIYEKKGDVNATDMAGYYQSLGNNHRQNGAVADAVTALEKAAALASDTADKSLMGAIFNSLGAACLDAHRYKEALDYLQTAKDLLEAAHGKDADHYTHALINLANLYEGTGNIDAAVQYFQEVATIYSQTPPANTQDVIDVLLNLSRITNSMGLTEQSNTLTEKALELVKLTYGDNSAAEADVYISRGAAAFADAAFEESLTFHFKALERLQANQYPGKENYAIIYNNIGQAYDELRETPLALKYKAQAVELYTEVFGPRHPAVAQAIGNVGLTYEMDNNYPEALKYLQRSLQIRLDTQGANHEDVGTNYLNIGLVLLKNKQPTEAIEHLMKAKAIYHGYAKHPYKAMICNRLAAAHGQLKKWDLAQKYYQEALVANTLQFEDTHPDAYPTQQAYLNYYEQMVALLGKVSLYTEHGAAGKLNTAANHLEAADEVLSSKAVQLTNARDRLKLTQLNFFFTEAAMALANRQYRETKNTVWLEKAFYYAERNKANELYADFNRHRAAGLAKLPRRLLQQQREIAATTALLEQQVAAAYQAQNLNQIERLKAKQLYLNQSFADLQKEIASTSPRYSKLVNERTLPGWADLKRVLAPNQAMVSYVITDSARYVLVGNSTQLHLRQLDKDMELEKWIRGYRNFITFKSEGYQTVGDLLYRKLWQPVDAILKNMGAIEEVIIIPDGILNYLPFEALGSPRFLGEQYAISYAPSATLLMATARQPATKKPALIALAPVFDDEATNFINKSCQRVVEATQKTDSTSRAFNRDGSYIAPLPATETEVQQIQQMHNSKDLLSRSFTKGAAREELIKKGELARYDYIHFATHGIANSQYPELSGLLLTQDAASTEDGMLYTGEILELDLKADLVTLSACETALGKRIEGEGVRGLTSAFLVAGARTVVVSLWKVADESTAIFMVEFYNQLLTGKSKSQALKAARKKLMADARYSHPYYWAPFVQVGAN
ncbi:MAG: CHAT domain-containing protein [Bacteroidota bacterium]